MHSQLGTKQVLWKSISFSKKRALKSVSISFYFKLESERQQKAITLQTATESCAAYSRYKSFIHLGRCIVYPPMSVSPKKSS